jgi:hypothetical protein
MGGAESRKSRDFRCPPLPKAQRCENDVLHLLVGADAPKLGTAPAIGLLELTEEVHQMTKFAPLMIAAIGMSTLAGCVAESTPVSEEQLAADSAAACYNPEGTNAAIAALATAMAQEAHRWEAATDFETFVGTYNQTMLRLTAAGKAACGGSCPATENLLALQDPRMDQKVVFNGVKLSSWSFASRLVSGLDKQKACKAGGWCPYVAHTFSTPTSQTGACDTLFTFPVQKPASQGGGNLTAAQTSQLINALTWASSNGPNPYIAFQSTASTVTIDPTGQMNPPGQSTGAEICQKFSTTDINGTPCTCATNNIYSNGQLKNNDPLTPKTYYCRQM